MTNKTIIYNTLNSWISSCKTLEQTYNLEQQIIKFWFRYYYKCIETIRVKQKQIIKNM